MDLLPGLCSPSAYTYASVYDEYTEVLLEYILPELPLMFSLFYLGLLINQ